MVFFFYNLSIEAEKWKVSQAFDVQYTHKEILMEILT